jgi:hypothetical protein
VAAIDTPEKIKAYRERKQKALAKTAPQRKAEDKRKAQINKTEAK